MKKSLAELVATIHPFFAGTIQYIARSMQDIPEHVDESSTSLDGSSGMEASLASHAQNQIDIEEP